MNGSMLPGSGERNDESQGAAFYAITFDWSRVEQELRVGGGYAESLNPSHLAGSSARELKLKDSGHTDQTGERVGSHFDHYTFAVCLDRALRGSQLGSHLLVQQTPGD
jgi:hypothetical protein